MAAPSLSAVAAQIARPTVNQLNPPSLPQTSVRPCNCFTSPWLGNAAIDFSRRLSNLGPSSSRNSPINATVSFSLPTAKPERIDSNEKLPKWSSKAIKSFAMGELEARKLRSPNTGTEALLMGILIEGTSFASKFLRANGITLLKVRDEIVKLLGKPNMYFFSPEHPPLAEATQKALDWAFDEKHKSGAKEEITTTHLLVGLWEQKESTGHKVLASLGFSDEKAKELQSMISEPGFKED